MYPCRKELVGKRFLCVRERNTNSHRHNSRSSRFSNPLDYQWKCGIIRACTEKDSSHQDLKVLVEYDDEDWTAREWLQVYTDIWKLFLVEKTLVWAQRVEPSNPRRPVLWPALTFLPLVDKHGLDENQSIAVEFFGDHVRAFCRSSEMRPYQDDNGLQPALRNNMKVVDELMSWQIMQKSQAILVNGPFTLTGFRVQVYREKCRQWFSAVITGHDLVTRELNVMDDTVLQTHRINPMLVMVQLLANDAELDSLLRGELVRVLPMRKQRQSQVVITSSLTSPSPTSSGASILQSFNELWNEPTCSPTPQVPITESTSRESYLPPSTTAHELSTGGNSTRPKRRRSTNSRTSKRKVSKESKNQSTEEVHSETRASPSQRLSPKSYSDSETDRTRHCELHNSPLYKKSEVEATRNRLVNSQNSSPMPLSFSCTSPIRSPESSPGRYHSPYSSMENLRLSSSSPQQKAHQQNVSPQRSFSSQKSSPLIPSPLSHKGPSTEKCGSPPIILDSTRPCINSPVHPVCQKTPTRKYTPNGSPSSMSPYKTNATNSLNHGACGSPMSNHHYDTSAGSPQNNMPCPSATNPLSAGHGAAAATHSAHHMMGTYSCQSRHVPQHNISAPQLYALQRQQQHQLQQQRLQQHQQHASSIPTQYLMQVYQLKHMAEQLQAMQQGTITTEQQEVLNLYHNQVLSQYQQAHILEQYAAAAAAQQSHSMSEEMNLQILQEHFQRQSQEHFQQQLQHSFMPRLEPEQLQTFFTCMQQQNMSMDQLQQLYSQLFLQQKQQKSQLQLLQHQDKEELNEHEAHLKQYMLQHQEEVKSLQASKRGEALKAAQAVALQANRLPSHLSSSTTVSHTSPTLQKSSSTQQIRDQLLPSQLTSDTLSEIALGSASTCTIVPPEQLEKEENKTDDQKVVAAMVKIPSLIDSSSTSSGSTMTSSAFTAPAKGMYQESATATKPQQPHKQSTYNFTCLDEPLPKENTHQNTSVEKPKIVHEAAGIGKGASDSVSPSKDAQLSLLSSTEESSNTSVFQSHKTSSELNSTVAKKKVSNRSSVIKHMPNKTDVFAKGYKTGNETSRITSVREDMYPFSVDQLLEFHKTSAQEAIKVFQDTNNVTSKEPDVKRKAKRRRKVDKSAIQKEEIAVMVKASEVTDRVVESVLVTLQQRALPAFITNPEVKDMEYSYKLRDLSEKRLAFDSDANKVGALTNVMTEQCHAASPDHESNKELWKLERNVLPLTADLNEDHNLAPSLLSEDARSGDKVKTALKSCAEKSFAFEHEVLHKPPATCLRTENGTPSIKDKYDISAEKSQTFEHEVLDKPPATCLITETRTPSIKDKCDKSAEKSHTFEDEVFYKAMRTETRTPSIKDKCDISAENSHTFEHEVLDNHPAMCLLNKKHKAMRTEIGTPSIKEKCDIFAEKSNTFEHEVLDISPVACLLNKKHKAVRTENRTPIIKDKCDISAENSHTFEHKVSDKPPVTCLLNKKHKAMRTEIGIPSIKDKCDINDKKNEEIHLSPTEKGILERKPNTTLSDVKAENALTFALKTKAAVDKEEVANSISESNENHNFSSSLPLSGEAFKKTVKNTVPVNFVADQAVLNLTTVERPPPMVALTCFSGTAIAGRFEARKPLIEEKGVVQSSISKASEKVEEKKQKKSRKSLGETETGNEMLKRKIKKKDKEKGEGKERKKYKRKRKEESNEMHENSVEKKGDTSEDSTQKKANKKPRKRKKTVATDCEGNMENEKRVRRKRRKKEDNANDDDKPKFYSFRGKDGKFIKMEQYLCERLKKDISIVNMASMKEELDQSGVTGDKAMDGSEATEVSPVGKEVLNDIPLKSKERGKDIGKLELNEEKGMDKEKESAEKGKTNDVESLGKPVVTEKEASLEREKVPQQRLDMIVGLTKKTVKDSGPDKEKKKSKKKKKEKEERVDKEKRKEKKKRRSKKDKDSNLENVYSKKKEDEACNKEFGLHEMKSDIDGNAEKSENNKDVVWMEIEMSKQAIDFDKELEIDIMMSVEDDADSTTTSTEEKVDKKITSKHKKKDGKESSKDASNEVQKKKRKKKAVDKKEDSDKYVAEELIINNKAVATGSSSGTETTVTEPNEKLDATTSELSAKEQHTNQETLIKELSEDKPLAEIISKLSDEKNSLKKTRKRRKKKKENDEDLTPPPKKAKMKVPDEEFFLQNGGCLMFPKLPRCRDCRDKDDKTPNGTDCCRFNLFRRLKRKKRSGRIQMAGFLMPEHAGPDDYEPWLVKDNVINQLSKEDAIYILSNVGDEFCSLVQEEKEAKTLVGAGVTVSYKRAVIGVREMCDACATTIFNIHWVCQKCGFGVCVDCYHLRVQERNRQQYGTRVFEFKWVHCAPGICHQPKSLSIAQIIPQQVMVDLSDQLHKARIRWKISDECPCHYLPEKEGNVEQKIQEITTELPKGSSDCSTETKKDDSQNIEQSTFCVSTKQQQNNIKNLQYDLKMTVKEIIKEKIREREAQRVKLLKNKDDSIKVERAKNPAQVNNQNIVGKADIPAVVKKESSDQQEKGNPTIDEKDLGCNERMGVDSPGGTDREEWSSEEKYWKQYSLGSSGAKKISSSDKKSEKIIIKASSGLSLLLNYNSSPDESPATTPATSSQYELEKDAAAPSAFDFNLDLLALVACKESQMGSRQQVAAKPTVGKEPVTTETSSTKLGEQQSEGEQKAKEKHLTEEAGVENVTSAKTEIKLNPDESVKRLCEEKMKEGTNTDTNLDYKGCVAKEVAVKITITCKSEPDKRASLDQQNTTIGINYTPSAPTVATKGECTSTESTSVDKTIRDQPWLDRPLITEQCPAPHSMLCNGRLLRLHQPHHPGNVKAFEKRWIEGKPVLVSQLDKLLDSNLWSPNSFEEEFGEELADVVNCRNGVIIDNFKVGAFWKGFESIKDRARDSSGQPMLLKLKDWPPGTDFSEKLPRRFKNLMDYIPLPEYTRRDGCRNLVSRLPDFFVKPDLGPKMYNAYGSASFPKEGTTNLHIDMSDAVNVMVYVGLPRDSGAGEKERRDAIKAVDEACDEVQQQRVRRESARIGALWHIYEVEDADKIRELLHHVAKERKMKYSAHHDPIHDQCFYLDHEIRQRLKRDYNVEGYAICQCLGDSVFIPAGAPHQVRNLYSCVKIAEDFVSPERIGQCFKTTQEFRHLSDKHTNHEDKLQVKNIIYHAVKDAVHALKHYEKEEENSEITKSD